MSSPSRRIALAGAFALAFSPFVQAQEQGGAPPDSVTTTAGELAIEQLASLEFPWGMALLPDGRLLVTEKPGRLRLWDSSRLSQPLSGVPEVVYRGDSDQGGLLDVELDPDFAQNRLVYLSYVEAAEQQPEELGAIGDARFGSLDTSDDIVRGGVVARARLENDRLQDLKVIWRQEPKTVGRGHFGNRLVFGPDGKLYITSGERMRFEPAQSLETNLGKVVRINPDGSIPEDNPFIGQDGARGDIWSYGHRNTLAIAFEPPVGRLWGFEMGPLGGDEVNLIEPGANYGWPRVSNGSHYNGQTVTGHPASDEFRDPVRTWTPVASPSGATWYDGERLEGWRDSMLVGGLTAQGLVRLTFQGEEVAVEERIDLQRRIRDVLQAPDGALLLLVDAKEGGLLRLSPAQ